MTTSIIIALGSVALVILALRTLLPSLDRAVDRAIRDDDAGPLVDALLRVKDGVRADAFNHSIRRLWDAYERALAMPVIRALAEHHADAAITQYWLAQAQSVEPELARDAFDTQFLQAYFRPEVAATCGKAG